MNEIKEKNIYEYQSIADKEPAKVKVVMIDKKRKRVEVSRDLIECLNPFRIDFTELK